MAIEGTVVVRTEVLKEKAQTVKTEIAKMNHYLDELATRLEGTRGYWIGEAGDLHRRLYNEQKENVAYMMKRLSEHPDDLMQMAGVYEAAENENTSVGQSLSGDVI